MKSFSEQVRDRESCREYGEKRPGRAQLEAMMRCAGLAPSACNSQPWRFYVVNDEKLSPEVARCTQQLGLNKFTSTCPAFIVICEEKARLMKRLLEHVDSQYFSQIDIGIVTAHLCYAAQEQGLSTCILGCFDEGALKELLGIGDDEKVRLVLCVGYAAREELREKKRKNMDEIFKYFGKEE